MKNKILNNLKLGLAGIVLAGGLNGCYILHLATIKKYAPLTAEQKDSLFKDLNSGLKECLNEVYIINDLDLGKETFAHTHNNSRTMCFSKFSKKHSKSRFHEVAHVKHLFLNKKKSDFSKRWRKIANFEYGKKNFADLLLDDGTLCSKNGILTDYSSKSIYEDVATFVECLSYDVCPEDIQKVDSNIIKNLLKKISKEKFKIDSLTKEKNLLPKPSSRLDSLLLKLYSSNMGYSYNMIEHYYSKIDYERRKQFNGHEELKFSYPLYFADTTDHRYKQKLDLLKEYNFLTKEEHEKLSENLGSLNYLLKEK